MFRPEDARPFGMIAFVALVLLLVAVVIGTQTNMLRNPEAYVPAGIPDDDGGGKHK